MTDKRSQYDWGKLVPIFVHPLKVAIIEAMLCLDEPLSASNLRDVFLGDPPLPNVHYHLSMLRKQGVVVKVGQEQKRGATETYFVVG